MKKVTYRDQIFKVLGISLVVFLFFSISLIAQEDVTAEVAVEAEAVSASDPAKGKSLFNQNCAACHALNRKMTGPALANVESRLAEDEGLDKEWLYAWIKNSSGMIKSGDAYANKVYAEYNQAAMTAFPTLSNQDIDDILAYTAAPPATSPPAAAGEGGAAVATASSGVSSELLLGALALVFAILIFMLYSVNATLKRVMVANGVEAQEEKVKRMPLWKAFAKNQFLVLGKSNETG